MTSPLWPASRYAVEPFTPMDAAQFATASPAAKLVDTIELARQAVVTGALPAPALQGRFTQALADLICEAMDEVSGEPVFQGRVLQHRWPSVNEYALLLSQQGADARAMRSAVNAVAHPQKQVRTDARWQRDAMAAIHAPAMAGAWTDLATTLQRLVAMPRAAHQASFLEHLRHLQARPELTRLQRLMHLQADPQVQAYRDIAARQGPAPGSTAAAHDGAQSRKRGAQAERRAADAVRARADHLGKGRWRVVTAMQTPAALSQGARGAKTEWDVVVLRPSATTSGWDIVLLLEVKASADAAVSDFPRLLRGLRLLASAEPEGQYEFATGQGAVLVSGASLRALGVDDATLARTVRYVCDTVPAGDTPLTLTPANRMRLLLLPASVAFAAHLLDGKQPGHARLQSRSTHLQPGPAELDAVWQALLTRPSLRPVLHHRTLLEQVHGLMVHPDDLMVALP